MTKIPILTIKNGKFGYKSSNLDFYPIVSNVNIEIFSGDFVVLEGPNGCGKSTIIKALLNLGAIYRGGIHLYLPMGKIGYIPQEIKIESSAPFSVAEIIRTAFPFKNVSDQKIIEVLNIVGLAEKKEVRFGILSGGEKRRILLARTLLFNPDFIILDEPTANIDKDSKNKLEQILYFMATQQNKAILATSHSFNWASKAIHYNL